MPAGSRLQLPKLFPKNPSSSCWQSSNVFAPLLVSVNAVPEQELPPYTIRVLAHLAANSAEQPLSISAGQFPAIPTIRNLRGPPCRVPQVGLGPHGDRPGGSGRSSPTGQEQQIRAHASPGRGSCSHKCRQPAQGSHVAAG